MTVLSGYRTDVIQLKQDGNQWAMQRDEARKEENLSIISGAHRACSSFMRPKSAAKGRIQFNCSIRQKSNGCRRAWNDWRAPNLNWPPVCRARHWTLIENGWMAQAHAINKRQLDIGRMATWNCNLLLIPPEVAANEIGSAPADAVERAAILFRRRIRSGPHHSSPTSAIRQTFCPTLYINIYSRFFCSPFLSFSSL